jgi:hypothetical protein
MRQLICIIVLLLSGVGAAFAEDFPEGTVVVFENGNYLSIVQRQTKSNKTHVAIILYDGAQPWVYESSKPNVHRYTLEEYIRRIEAIHKQLPQFGVHFLKPQTPYTPAQVAAMKKYAHAQLGRGFAIHTYLTGRPGTTIHCSEYVGNTLSMSGRFVTTGPKENPKTIFEKASKL